MNRTYDSKQGRFTQVDPIGMNAASLAAPQTLNLYTYCGNDPVNYTDPSGLFWGKLFKWIGKIFKAVTKILKWVVVAVAVAAVVIAIVVSPEASLIFLKAVIGFIGKIMGISIHSSPMVYSLSTGALTGGTSISIGIAAKIAAGLYAVGAVAIRSASDDPPAEDKNEVIKVETNCPKNLRIETPECPSPWWAKGNIGKLNSWLEGFADGLLFDLPSKINEWRGVNMGSDFDSAEYNSGWWTGTAGSLIVPAGAGGKAVQGANLGTKLFSRSAGVLNRNRYIRLGWNKYKGKDVFRLSIGNRKTKYNPHWNIWKRK